MLRFLLMTALLVSSAWSTDDYSQYQYQSVKGGHGGSSQYNPAANLVALFGDNSTQGRQGQQGYGGYDSTYGTQTQHGYSGYDTYNQNNKTYGNQQGFIYDNYNGTQRGYGGYDNTYNQHGYGGYDNTQSSQQGYGSYNNTQHGYGGYDNTHGTQTQHGYGGYDNTYNQQRYGNYNSTYGNHQGFDSTHGSQFGGYGGGMRHNLTSPINYEVGVCYVEVPTASLVKDTSHVPAGNGSRPDLSRIRTCCKGYIRNIHNYKICDPVCSQECVNALCTAPETCTCFPDHVKNLAGFCVATCPIGCQNGRCDGGECLCKEGYKLDSDSKFCLPSCRGNCGGTGNCTSPNTCECKRGYESTSDGSCKPVCNRCINGDCVGPNECRCKLGYVKNPQGECSPHCSPECSPTGRCVSPNTCEYPPASGRIPNPPPLSPSSHHSYPPSPRPVPHSQTTTPSPYPLYTQVPNKPSNYPYPDQQLVDVPQCSQPCINGICVEGNRCICNTGYVLDKADPSETRCVPNCPGGCPNGVCSAPNFCICNMGYYKDHSVKGRSVCVKRVRRSADLQPELPEKPVNVAELLVFEIPDY